MSKPPILAYDREAAEPRVREAAKWLAPRLRGRLHDFYACEPCEHQVRYENEEWTEGWWGAVIHVAGGVSLSHLARLQAEFSQHYAGAVELDDVDFSISAPCSAKHGISFRLELTCTLSARLADEDGDTCQICGASLSLVQGLVHELDPEGCPACLPCGGLYSSGTEECGFCTYSDFCAEAHGNQ